MNDNIIYNSMSHMKAFYVDEHAFYKACPLSINQSYSVRKI